MELKTEKYIVKTIQDLIVKYNYWYHNRGGGGGGNTIYTGDDSITGNRTVFLNGNSLNFINEDDIYTMGLKINLEENICSLGKTISVEGNSYPILGVIAGTQTIEDFAVSQVGLNNIDLDAGKNASISIINSAHPSFPTAINLILGDASIKIADEEIEIESSRGDGGGQAQSTSIYNVNELVQQWRDNDSPQKLARTRVGRDEEQILAELEAGRPAGGGFWPSALVRTSSIVSETTVNKVELMATNVNMPSPDLKPSIVLFNDASTDSYAEITLTDNLGIRLENDMITILSEKTQLGKSYSSDVLTFATLPSAPTSGQRATINDCAVSMVGNFGSVASGGGTETVPVFFDGTDWRIG